MGDWLSLAEAARATGLTADTLRRRVKRGELIGRKVETAYGPAWQVSLNGAAGQGVETITPTIEPATPRVDASAHGVAGTITESPALLEALRFLEKLQEENRHLAGQVGFYQAKVQTLEEQLALQAPKPAEPPVQVQDTPEPLRGWHRLFHWLGA